MSFLLTLLAGAIVGKNVVTEARRKPIPASYFRNTELQYEDQVVRCIPLKQITKLTEQGRYYLPDVPPDAKIDDMEAYKKDSAYDFLKAYKRAQKGYYAESFDKYAKVREQYGNISDRLAYLITLGCIDDWI